MTTITERIQQLPDELQDKIWGYVLPDWQKEHKAKFYHDLSPMIEFQVPMYQISQIEDPEQKFRETVAFLNEHALQGNLYVSGAMNRYNEIFFKGWSKQIVSSVWRQNFIGGKDRTLYQTTWDNQESRAHYLHEITEIEPDRFITHTWVQVGEDVLYVPIQLPDSHLD